MIAAVFAGWTARRVALVRGLALALLWPAVAYAVIVTAAQVAEAVRNSPSANAFLKAHADEIGALALKVENRRGDTQIYNGSCCYGILQMTGSNIRHAGFTIDQYRSASLQTQIDTWARMQSQALADPVLRQLQTMGTFNGQPVDASMMIACVQLGQGNCRTMVRSGRCSGFEDRNGTDICEMAAVTRAAIGGGAGGAAAGGGVAAGGGGAAGAAGPVVPAYTGNGIIPALASVAMAPGDAYHDAAGISMSDTADSIKLVLSALMLTFLTWLTAGTFGGFAKGQMSVHVMGKTILRGVVVTLMVLAVTLGV